MHAVKSILGSLAGSLAGILALVAIASAEHHEAGTTAARAVSDGAEQAVRTTQSRDQARNQILNQAPDQAREGELETGATSRSGSEESPAGDETPVAEAEAEPPAAEEIGPVFTGSPEEIGLQVAEAVDESDRGWTDSTANLKMILRNKGGDTSERQLRSRGLEVLDDGDKSLIVFDSPRDVKGTAFLSFSHALEPDEQWLFLPALKRVKRISSGNKSGPFMGSEFAYEDMASDEVEKYKYKWLRDEVWNGMNCWVVEQYPQYKKSGYKRRIVWTDKARLVPVRIDYYDRKDSLLKTLEFTGYNKYLDKHWRPTDMDMVNHQTGKSTTLRWTEFKFQTGLDKRDFSENALKRIR